MNHVKNKCFLTLAYDTSVKRCPSTFSPKTVLSDATNCTHEKKTNPALADLGMVSLLKTLINGNGYKEDGC